MNLPFNEQPHSSLPPKEWIEKLITSVLQCQFHSTPSVFHLPFFLNANKSKQEKKEKKDKKGSKKCKEVNPQLTLDPFALMDEEVNLKKSKKNASTRTCAMYLRVLDLLHENLTLGQTTTIRDLFYHDVTLFQSQQVVHKIIDSIAYTYGAPREHFNIIASPRGLGCGQTTCLHFSNGKTMSLASNAEGVLLPNTYTLTQIETQAHFVLVIEKEATFQSLINLRFHELYPCLLITGKGFPDLNTKRFVTQVHELTHLPIYFLMDGDPYGIHIFLIYNESFQVGHFLGIEPEEIMKSTMFNLNENQYLPLTSCDRQRGFMLLRSTLLNEGLNQLKLRRALQYLLFYNVKMEIQILSNAMLLNYLIEKLKLNASI